MRSRLNTTLVAFKAMILIGEKNLKVPMDVETLTSIFNRISEDYADVLSRINNPGMDYFVTTWIDYYMTHRRFPHQNTIISWTGLYKNSAVHEKTPCVCGNCGYKGTDAKLSFRVNGKKHEMLVEDRGGDYGYDTSHLRKTFNIPSNREIPGLEIHCPNCGSITYDPVKNIGNGEE